MTMERRIGGDKSGMLTRELHRQHQAHWSPETIGDFWVGTSFKDPRAQTSLLSYSLADILVDLLVQEFPNFMDFVALAKWQDAGASAADEILAVSLADIAGAFLGPGDWNAYPTTPAE